MGVDDLYRKANLFLYNHYNKEDFVGKKTLENIISKKYLIGGGVLTGLSITNSDLMYLGIGGLFTYFSFKDSTKRKNLLSFMDKKGNFKKGKEFLYGFFPIFSLLNKLTLFTGAAILTQGLINNDSQSIYSGLENFVAYYGFEKIISGTYNIQN